MKKGQILEGVVERVEFPNKGVVVVENEEMNVIIKNTIPGQKVRFGVSKKRKGKAEGRLLEVIEKSKDEVESLCPHFELCGGCTYQTLPYEKQLEIKANQVKNMLDKVYENKGLQVTYEFEGVKPSPNQFEYRNKMEFSFGDEFKDGPLSLGMHKRGSFYDIVSVPMCQIVDNDYRLILTYVLDFFKEKNANFYHKMRHEGFLRHLLVRKGKKTGEILIALVTSTQDVVSLDGFVEGLLALQGDEGLNECDLRDCDSDATGCENKYDNKLNGKIVGILHTENDSLADVVKSDNTHVLYGQDFFYEEILGLKFKISQFSFFQTNSLGAEVLYEAAREYVGSLCEDGKPDKVVFDLYSGTGTIAQLLAPVAKKVIGVEIVEEAVEAAKKNATLNNLDNCEFIAGDVLKVIDDITEKPDMIVLDPPRDGIHPKALQKIIDYGVDRIVYISCKPTSLARDLEVFFEQGYVMEKACGVDMFPGTYHVECVTLLQRIDT